MTPEYKEEEGRMLVNIEVDCECEGGACEHMISEVQKAVQHAYNLSLIHISEPTRPY